MDKLIVTLETVNFVRLLANCFLAKGEKFPISFHCLSVSTVSANDNIGFIAFV